jgi:hypothetical protein
MDARAGPIIQTDATSLMAVISRAASDPNTDVDKLERLMSLYERITKQQAKAAFTAALAEMQPRLPIIDEKGGIKDRAGNVQSTYAKWDDIAEAIRPLLHEYGFTLTFRVVTTPKVAVTGVLSHRDGHTDETTMELPVDDSGSKNTVQAVGSSFSYGKRYTAIALLNITSRAKQDRDDDGQAGGARGYGEIAKRAIEAINGCETLVALKAWKDTHFDGVSKMAEPDEIREIVALFKKRAAAFRERASDDFHGDRR